MRENIRAQLKRYLPLLVAVTVVWLVLSHFGITNWLFSQVDRFLTVTELKVFADRQKQFVQPRMDRKIALITKNLETSRNPQIRRIFGREPFPRDVYGYVVRFLNRSRPKALLFDVEFSTGDDLERPERDRFFADSILDAPYRVIFSFMPQRSDTQPAETGRFFRDNAPDILNHTGKPLAAFYYHSAALPFSALLGTPAEFRSNRTLNYDMSGSARFFMPFNTLQNPARPQEQFHFTTMPLAALAGDTPTEVLENFDLKIGDRLIQAHGRFFPIIRWYGDVRGPNAYPPTPEIYPRYNLADIVLNQLAFECSRSPAPSGPVGERCRTFSPEDVKPVDPEVFRDHYVLYGIDTENADTHQTIYQSNYPGIYIQANILDNLLHDEFVRPVTGPWTWGFSLVLCLLGGFVCYTRPVIFGTVMILFTALAYHVVVQVAYLHHNLWLNETIPLLALTITVFATTVIRYVRSEQRKKQLRYAFAKYVSPAAMQTIEKDPTNLHLGGQRRNLTFMFCDIRGFTSFSESNDPEYVQAVLSRYFTVMNRIILHHYNGAINKLMGDAIMAYWGFPLCRDDHAYQTVAAALAMKKAMEEWHADPENPPIRIGIGINTGDAIIGNVGSEDFMDFTVIGDAVNIAARLESLNKEYGTTIIISSTTRDVIQDRVEIRRIGTIRVRGKEQETEIFEPIRLLSETERVPEIRPIEKPPGSVPVILPKTGDDRRD